MLIIDQDGNYQYKQGTKTLLASDHPVYRARIDLGLPQGAWLYAPNAGHTLNRFNQVKMTAAKRDEYLKEVGFYLSKYDPQVVETFFERFQSVISLKVAEE